MNEAGSRPLEPPARRHRQSHLTEAPDAPDPSLKGVGRLDLLRAGVSARGGTDRWGSGYLEPLEVPTRAPCPDGLLCQGATEVLSNS